jgi:putative sigma-54 modulation protein
VTKFLAEFARWTTLIGQAQSGYTPKFFADIKLQLLTFKIVIAMNVNIQTVRFDADAKLLDHVSRKVRKLNNFHDRITTVEVFLKLDNVVHQIKDKIAEIKVLVPRHEFFVKQSSKSFEASFDSALEALINQIKRQKEKTKTTVTLAIVR